ncbi:hypothetical protein E3N88_10390 [Mikania micrantha]|uniref:Integrase catalytic domain-containing protein n=1 Tax=Mikania micrantha TaxID=192012 RepID=A0A5N6PBM0_9ASTR|nr:hypothetical protein E3N88_10390 [Mikania micrantha]
MALGVPHIEHRKQVCYSCLLGKQTRLPFPDHSNYRAKRPLELVYADVCGPISPMTQGGNKYMFLIVDDHSQYMWAFLIKTKDEVFECFKKFKNLMELELGTRLKTLRMDDGGEFTSRVFEGFCDGEGITHQFSAPYTPQQNRVVERKNRSVLGMTRSILKAMDLPQNLWVPSNHLKKLDDRSQRLVHLGVQPNTKAYRLFDPMKKKIVVSIDVIFEENTRWKWENYLEEFDTQTPGWMDFIVQINHEDVESMQPNSEGATVAEQNTFPSAESASTATVSEPSSPLTAPNSPIAAEFQPDFSNNSASSSPESVVAGRGPMLPRLSTDLEGPADPSNAEQETYDDSPIQEVLAGEKVDLAGTKELTDRDVGTKGLESERPPDTRTKNGDRTNDKIGTQ